MWRPPHTAAQVLRHPGRFTLGVIGKFRENQGFLLAGAVAYYALLSLVPLLILMLMLLSQLFPEERLLVVLREYLEFVVPGLSNRIQLRPPFRVQSRPLCGAWI